MAFSTFGTVTSNKAVDNTVVNVINSKDHVLETYLVPNEKYDKFVEDLLKNMDVLQAKHEEKEPLRAIRLSRVV